MPLRVRHITFVAHGAGLHGDERPTVDRTRNQHGTPYLAPNVARRVVEQSLMSAPPVVFSHDRRLWIEQAVPCMCEDWSWSSSDVLAVDHLHCLIAIERRYHGK